MSDPFCNVREALRGSAEDWKAQECLTKLAAINRIAAQTSNMAEHTHRTIANLSLTCTADAAIVHFKYLLARLHHKRVINPNLPCIRRKQNSTWALKTGSANI